MSTKKMDAAVGRFLFATSSIRRGLIVQRQRIQDAYDACPRLFEGEPHEVIELSALHENDLDYYAYELGRLQDVAKAMQRPLGNPPEIPPALEKFERAIPRLRDFRNPRTHFANTDDLDAVVVLASALAPDKDDDPLLIEQLVAPLSSDHEAALELLNVLDEVLHEKLHEAMVERPPRPRDVQIAERNCKHPGLSVVPNSLEE